jgi:hypothetical protein
MEERTVLPQGSRCDHRPPRLERKADVGTPPKKEERASHCRRARLVKGEKSQHKARLLLAGSTLEDTARARQPGNNCTMQHPVFLSHRRVMQG